jgi:5-methyltetrahydropteroyltriglutamate--homocysteine methyltransferase
MKRSTDRILTTHAGSLPRPDHLVQMMWDKIDGKTVDADELARAVRSAVGEVVTRQRVLGLDVVSDGEMSKIGFSNYIFDRLTGFGGRVGIEGDDLLDFPGVAGRLFANEAGAHILMLCCEGPVTVRDSDAVHIDIANLQKAIGKDASPGDAFIAAPTPGQIAFNNPNRFYSSHEEYLEAVAAAMRHEYKAIVDAGLDLQLDSPDLAMSHHFRSIGTDIDDWRVHVSQAIDALNGALEGIPPERVRLHVCWGNYGGPHNHDVPLRDIIEPVLRARVGAIYVEAGNPRHAHEWEVFEEVDLPDDQVLVVGTIDVTTHRIEHPRLVAQRLVQYARLLGRERVVAATDCGFGTFVGYGIDPDVAWAKLESLVEGARLASAELW